MSKPRLYVECALPMGGVLVIEGDGFHYLTRVMRMGVGDRFEAFNGKSDGMEAQITETGKRKLTATITGIIRDYQDVADLSLAFAPVKKARTDFIVEKATELGVRDLYPIRTEYTNSERIRIDRLQRITIEAAEQCGSTFVPQVHPIANFAEFVKSQNGRTLLFADETATQSEVVDWGKPATIFIGPEGGWSSAERALISPLATTISLGSRILRADTAAVAAITLWQKQSGVWI